MNQVLIVDESIYDCEVFRHYADALPKNFLSFPRLLLSLELLSQCRKFLPEFFGFISMVISLISEAMFFFAIMIGQFREK